METRPRNANDLGHDLQLYKKLILCLDNHGVKKEHPAHFGRKLAHWFHEDESISNLALHPFSFADSISRAVAFTTAMTKTTVLGKSRTHEHL